MMKDIARHVKQRYRSSWKLLLAGYTLFIFTMQGCFLNIREHEVRNSTFETFVDNRFAVAYFGLCMVILLLMLFIHLFRQYHNQSDRWLLLPQKRSCIVIGDMVWIILSILPCYIAALVLYRFGFSHYLALLDKYEIISYSQTHDFALSLYRCAFTQMLYPEDLGEILRNILCVSAIATFLPCIVTYLVKKDTQRIEAFLLIAMGVICIAIVLLKTTWFTNICFILISYLSYSYSSYSWINRLIGGLKDARN